jgi:NADP-dependent 3-hydroxy acid dehydrogenase YdfG
MRDLRYDTALIGAGSGISASVDRAAFGAKVGLAAHDTAKLAALAAEIDAITFAADASESRAVAALLDEADRRRAASAAEHLVARSRGQALVERF